MSRTFLLAVLCLALVIALGFTLRTLLLQRNTIAELSANQPRGPAEEPEPGSNAELVATTQPEQPASRSQEAQESTSSVQSVDAALVLQNEQLQVNVQRLEAELAEVKRLVPETEDATRAYVGPGVWLNHDSTTRGIRRVEISGKPSPGNRHIAPMAIKAWTACNSQDCYLGEVELVLLNNDNRTNPDRQYRRALAVWEYETSKRFALVTFEKEGLRIEMAWIYNEASGRVEFISVYRLTRLN